MVKNLAVFFSNHLEILYQQLKSSLFGFSSSPFKRRIVVVYGPAMKAWLMLRMAQDPELNVAMGIEFVYLSQAFEFLLKLRGGESGHVPTLLELKLAVEAQLYKVIRHYPCSTIDEQQDWQPVLDHLKLKPDQLGSKIQLSRKMEKRLTGLSQQLARLFQDYGRYAFKMVSKWDNSDVTGWQPRLWRLLFGKSSGWSYPARSLHQDGKTLMPFSLSFFSISFITRTEFAFLDQLSEHVSVNYYMLSPCAVFWSDIRSDRESAYLQHYWNRKLGPDSSQLLQLEELLQDRNPLLANFGRLGREMACQIEESLALTSAVYSLPQSVQMLDQELFLNPDLHLTPSQAPLSLLQALQADLLMMRNPKNYQPYNFEQEKGSIQLHVAVSKRREVQILYHNVLTLMSKDSSLSPGDVIVMSPQIRDYAPYIESIFGMDHSQLDYQILDLNLQARNEIVQGFLQLLELSESRWDAVKLLQLFEHSAFQRCHQLSYTDYTTIREWIVKAGIRWGDDLLHRNELLQKRHCQKGMVEETMVGTWDWGLSRLMMGLTMTADQVTTSSLEISPCSIVDFSQRELLGKWIRLLHGLRDDIAPLHDQTRLTLEDWVNYLICLLESYFQPDYGNSKSVAEYDELKSVFEILRNSSKWIKEETFSFCSVKSSLLSLLQSRDVDYREEHLQAIRFCSLMPLRSIPAKVIALLSMQEGAFPRVESMTSMNLMITEKESDYRPLSHDYDRYLFLEALQSAQDYLLVSYLGYNQEENKELKPSLLIEELFSYLDHSYTIKDQKISASCTFKHPFDSFNYRYFDHQSDLHNYFQHDFSAAQAYYAPSKLPGHAFLANFDYLENERRKNLPNDSVIDLKQLLAVVRDPIKFHLNRVLEIYLKTESDREIKTEEELIISSLDKLLLKQLSLKHPIKEVLNLAEKEGRLPLGVFKVVAQQRLQKEAIEIEKGLQQHELDHSNITHIEFCRSCSSPLQVEEGRWLFPAIILKDQEGNQLSITGKVPFASPKGMVLLGKQTFEDIWKIWPQYLIYCFAAKLLPEQFEPNLVVPQGTKMFHAFFEDPEPHLQCLIHYYALCLQTFSPLMPEWIPLIIADKAVQLHEKMEDLFKHSYGVYQSPYLPWCLNKSNLPNATILIQDWKKEANDLAGEMLDHWFPIRQRKGAKNEAL